MQKNHTRGILAIGIICLFIGVGIHPVFAVRDRTSSDSSTTIFENNNSSIISLNADEHETFGFYMGLIIGGIYNLQGSASRVTFIASSVTIYPSGQKLINVDAWINKPYLGIITTKFIFVIGIIYSGW